MMNNHSKNKFHKVHNYFVGRQISSSSFSSVRAGFHQVTNEIVIFKIISKNKMKSFQEWQQIIFSESCLYPNLKYSHIFSVHEVISTSSQIFIVIEKEEIGLNEYLKNTQLCFNEELSIADQLLSAVEYLHDRNICHRDLKMENVMVDACLRAKLIDFGFARYSPDLISGKCGSYGYGSAKKFLKNLDMMEKSWFLFAWDDLIENI
jgi:serine/threonine protein kinase